MVPAVAVGWFAFSVLTAGEPVDTLDIGECFMEEAGEEITGVDTVDCAESHDLELFAKIEITGFGEEYPGNDGTRLTLGAKFPGVDDAMIDTFRPLVERSAATIKQLIETET